MILVNDFIDQYNLFQRNSWLSALFLWWVECDLKAVLVKSDSLEFLHLNSKRKLSLNLEFMKQ
jgi:hypothetical protein